MSTLETRMCITDLIAHNVALDVCSARINEARIVQRKDSAEGNNIKETDIFSIIGANNK